MKALVLLLALSVAGCFTVRQEDLDAWAGLPVTALDMHSFFLTVPMVRTVTADGVEVRNYVNRVGVGNCGGGGTLAASAFNNFMTCVSTRVGCDNLFFIRDGHILEYKPVGRCRTNATVRPEPGYDRFTK